MYPDSYGIIADVFGIQMDALPAIGHACGHNLIAISGM
jgi:metal-dependent amidase/aminoacylase/carboxypeptidase family protein